MAHKTKKQRSKRKQAKPKFTSRTRWFDLVRKEFHPELRQFVNDISYYLLEGAPDDWKNFVVCNVDYEKIRKSDFIYKIAEFLFSIGKEEGLRCSLRVFCQYLSKTEHSNFCLKESSIKTQIIRMLSYIKEKKDKNEKW